MLLILLTYPIVGGISLVTIPVKLGGDVCLYELLIEYGGSCSVGVIN